MAPPVDRNRLSEEASPYLQQHADNPVNWQPWDQQARQMAREHDVPIFLSVGYAACHWCHVMEEESFQDEAVAAILNEHFVPIKVDREERPDLDRVYQTVCQLVTGHGGWPLSVWLTPDQKPFYVGTYFPPDPAHGRPGFGELLTRIRDAWETEREDLESRADQWLTAASREFDPDSGDSAQSVEPESPLGGVMDAAVRSADRTYGGFGQDGPKFPHPRRLEALLWGVTRQDRPDAESVVRTTLDAMANGGMYDHLGGGFHRYATDRKWVVPHFEKMLYDNAMLPQLYLDAALVFDEEHYRSVADETFSFLDRELRHPEGGYYSSLDAQTGGKEGTYYIWTPAEVDEVLDDQTVAEALKKVYGISESGNFEDGSTVLTRTQSIEAVAAELDSDPATLRTQVEQGRAELLQAREGRERPRRDEKILASWNGLLLSALARGGLLIDETLLDNADRTLTFLIDHLWDDDNEILYRRFRDGSVGISGYLDDYGFLARGALDLYQMSGNPEPLLHAAKLADTLIEEFWDPKDQTLYYTPASGETIATRPDDSVDQSLPASLGVALETLLELDRFVPSRGYATIVEQSLETHRHRIRSAPLQHVGLALVAERLDQGMIEATVTGSPRKMPWGEFFAKRFLPGGLLAPRPKGKDEIQDWVSELGESDVPPIWRGRAGDGQSTLYLCHDFTCSPPLTDPAEAHDWLERFRESDNTDTTGDPPI